MKVFGCILLLLVVAGVVVYTDGARLPYYHTVSVTGIVPAPQDKVFALITNVAKGSDWRPAVKSVTVLQQDKGRDHWVEHLDHGDVLLDEPKASYGGAWTYELSPGPTPNTTTLSITESGFIKPPVYRFIMTHVIGPTHNLDQYMKDIQAAAAH